MTPLTVRLLASNTLKSQWRRLHTSPVLSNFHEYDKRFTYPEISDFKEESLNPLQRIYRGYFQFIEETKKFAAVIKDSLHVDPNVMVYPDEVDVQFQFRGDPKVLNDWIVTCDSDYNHGHSKAK